jgi:hypothetical protein
MTDDVEVVEGTDGRITVILHHDAKISREAVIELLRACGVYPDKISFLEPGDALDPAKMDESCTLFPVDEETADLPELEEAARCRAQGGGTVVVLFGEKYAPAGLHPIAANYGTQCGWRSEELASRVKRIAGADGPVDAGGSPVHRPEPNQVKC